MTVPVDGLPSLIRESTSVGSPTDTANVSSASPSPSSFVATAGRSAVISSPAVAPLPTTVAAENISTAPASDASAV